MWAFLRRNNKAPKEEKKRRFFFDQQGKLTSHFGIARVPAVVEPAGQVLKISEIEMSGAGA